MSVISDKKKSEDSPDEKESRGEKLTGAAIKVIRNVPGLRESVLSGVALLTRHNTAYLQAKLKQQESDLQVLTVRNTELNQLNAIMAKHLVDERNFGIESKRELAEFRRSLFFEHRKKKIQEHFPEYAHLLQNVPIANTVESALFNAESPVLVFTHIQKTAGNSVIAYLRSCVTAERVVRIHEFEMSSREKISEALAEKFGLYDVVAGHIPFCRRVDKLIDRPTFNISIMREPVDRVVSLYFYLKANASWLDQGKHIVDQKITLEQFANSDAYFDNHMVRMMCDLEPISVAKACCTREMLEQAKVNLINHFLLVGLTESAPDYINMLSSLFCWSRDDMPRENVNEKRSPLSSAPASALQALGEVNSYDVELYAFAKKLWEVTTSDWLSKFSKAR